jgi:putative spermidine/putrescine transport system permease protein
VSKRGHGLIIAALMLPAVGFVAVFLAAVLTMTVMQSLGLFSFNATEQIGIQDWTATATRQTWDSFFYSVKIALVSAFGALIIAYPLALYLRRQFAGKATLNALIRVPLFVPALVAAFLILNVMSFHGIFNEVLVRLGILAEPLRLTHDDWGVSVVLIQIWKNLPFLALILAAVLANIPGDLEAAARNLGAGPFEVFLHVLLPLSIPGVQTGITLVFIGVLGDYAVNAVAGPLYPPSLAIRMYLLGRNFGEWGQAAVIALIIMVSSLLFAWLFSILAKLTVRAVR